LSDVATARKLSDKTARAKRASHSLALKSLNGNAKGWNPDHGDFRTE
jgi:hypothetical protein